MTREVINEFKVTDEQAANMVNMISTIKGVLVWALIIEYADGKIKARLRSKGPSVNELANKYNGGGHAKASGATLSSWDYLDNFVNDCNQLVIDYRKSGF